MSILANEELVSSKTAKPVVDLCLLSLELYHSNRLSAETHKFFCHKIHWTICEVSFAMSKLLKIIHRFRVAEGKDTL